MHFLMCLECSVVKNLKLSPSKTGKRTKDLLILIFLVNYTDYSYRPNFNPPANLIYNIFLEKTLKTK